MNIKIYFREGEEKEQFLRWFKKKQQLNTNIARVCSEYGDYIDKISGRVLDRRMFLHYDNMVNCIIQKVQILATFFLPYLIPLNILGRIFNVVRGIQTIRDRHDRTDWGSSRN